jgi:putative transposase
MMLRGSAVERIWPQEGLKVPARQPKRGRLWFTMVPASVRPEHRNHVWAYDFVFDRMREGRPLKLLNVVDAFTRESLAIEVARQQSARSLAGLMLRHGIPKHIRPENGYVKSFNGKLRDELLNGEASQRSKTQKC